MKYRILGYCMITCCLYGCGESQDASDTSGIQKQTASQGQVDTGSTVPENAPVHRVRAGAIPAPGTYAPDFMADIVIPDETHPAGKLIQGFELSSLIGHQRILLLTYPKNCTFICPTELLGLSKRLGEFKKLGFEVLVLSTDEAALEKDPDNSHQAWRLKSDKPEKGKAGMPMGIGNVGFTMVADPDHKIIRAYGVEGENGLALRASFFIGLDGKVHVADVQSINMGRDIDELLRKAAALKFVEENSHLVTPEGWQPGDKGMKPTHEGVRKQVRAKAQ